MEARKTEQEEQNEKRIKGRNLKKDEVQTFIKEFLATVNGVNINGKKFANSVSLKSIGTNPDLSIEEIQKTLGVNDKSKIDFLRQLYIRGGSSIISRVFPDENIVNLPTISFAENGNAIDISF